MNIKVKKYCLDLVSSDESDDDNEEENENESLKPKK